METLKRSETVNLDILIFFSTESKVRELRKKVCYILAKCIKRYKRGIKKIYVWKT